jgi:steroid 5-alpha reductase family enzyme
LLSRSFVYVVLVYAGALGAAGAIVHSMPTLDPLLSVALADFAATIVVFVGSRRANNSSIYDPYWSVLPIAIAVWFATLAVQVNARFALVLLAVLVWGVRLTWNWARGWGGIGHEDWRYVNIRKKTGRLYWPASFLGIHLFPTVLTYLGSLPMLPALTSAAPFSVLDGLAALVTFAAIAIEWISDEQLRRFRATQPNGACNVGLWKFSRHPNYFGEILFWVGLWLFGVAAGAPAWMAVGPVAMLALFVFASIPMAEKHAVARRPEYAERIRDVSMLFPWFPKRT